ncbi:response regulator [Flavobacterium sp. J372]|uniref:response regulator n=1 Tax=Flavobacterium sp. J372 TaxID=2898436 RepID=UPI0021513835|nr:response regulator [Flavobacterium sp. J372]MCR5860939.1 response regulator [Flavobacterium sp. J372]
MNLNWKNIFLADDDADDREFFADALKEVKQDVVLTESRDGQELMKLLQNPDVQQPDVIFLDLNMPVKSGYQCLEEIRRDDNLKDSVVVIFTTSSLQEDIDRLYAMGANLFITKPTNFLHLKELISKVFSLDWMKGQQRPDRDNFSLS